MTDDDAPDGEENDTTSEAGADPFEQFESDVGDREGDPFEKIAGDAPDEQTGPEAESAANPSSPAGESSATGDEQTSPDANSSGSDWVEEFGIEQTPGTPGRERESPKDIASEGSEMGVDSEERAISEEMNLDVGRRDESSPDPLGDVGPREGDPFEEGGSLFEERDTESIDPDAVWQDLASADSRGASGESYERTFADVSKHSYCEHCEHFSPPPEVACTHEGTDIVEFLDMETVRVVDCPVVAERRELERDG